MALTNEADSPDQRDNDALPSPALSTDPLLPVHQNPENEQDGMTRPQALSLYTSHFLSTWNVRTYEFAVIIFTAAAYPDTLIAAAIRGIVRTIASICLSSVVGRMVDSAPSRLKTLLATITLNRISVILATGFWFFLIEPNPLNNDHGWTTGAIIKGSQFTAILALGIVETLSGNGNMLSMERDWVPALRAPDGKDYDLTHLNAVMRRIDLVCKLIAPIVISAIVSLISIRTGVLVVGGMSAASWAVEWQCAKRVWDTNPRLRVLKAPGHQDVQGDADADGLNTSRLALLQRIQSGIRRYLQDFKNYFSSNVWIPSLSLTFLHISALSYSAVFITYLLNIGFSLEIITIARAAGSVVEISSTIVTPVGVQYLSKAHGHRGFYENDAGSQPDVRLPGDREQEDGSTETGLERLGLWGISWQLINLVPVVFALWSLSLSSVSNPLLHLVSRSLSPMTSQPLSALTLFFFLSLSRLGLWIYDLTTQQLTQTMTIPSQRSAFTGVEYSFVSLFELSHNIAAIVLHRPQDFKWLASGSLCAVAISTFAYAGWVWKMRGHLVHWEKFGKSCECVAVGVGVGHDGWRRRLGDSLSLRSRR